MNIYSNEVGYINLLKDVLNYGVPGVVYIDKPLKSVQDMLDMEWYHIDVKGLIVNKEPFKTERPPMAV